MASLPSPRSAAPPARGLVSKRVFLPPLLTLALLAIGCGGGSTNSNSSGGGVSGVDVQVISPTGSAALDANQTLAITVQVTDNGSPDGKGVTWNVAPNKNGDPVGTLTNPQPTTVTYNPPPGLAAQAQVTVTATSVTDPTRSAAIPLSVYPTPTIVSPSSIESMTGYVNTDYTCVFLPIGTSVTQVPCQIVALGGLGPYTWSLGNTLLPTGLQLAPGNTGAQPCAQFVGPNGTPNCEEIVGQPITTGIYQVSITGTDSLGVSATLPFTINIAPSQLKVATPTLLTYVPGEPYAPVQLQPGGGKPPYLWSLASGSGPLPQGMTLTPNGVISGTPDPGISNSYSFALQVTDSQSPVPAQAIFPTPQPVPSGNIISLGVASDFDSQCIAGSNSVQAGTPYAFLFTGFDADGPVTISGSFTSDSQGNLTGEEDIIRTSGALTATALAPGSSITFNNTGHGCLTLNTASSTAQFRVAPTTIATSGSVPYYQDGNIVEFDDTTGTGTRGTGFFRIQNSADFSLSSISGPYAFQLSGYDADTSHFAMAGTATANNGLIASADADINDGGVFSGALTGGTGMVGSVDANGRGTATLSIGAATYDLIFYVVDSTHLLFNSPQAATNGHPLISGEATASAGPFAQATFSNSHIYHFGGSVAGSPDVGVGVLHFDGIGSVSGTAYERSGGTATATTIAQQYTVDPTTGRFTFSGTGLSAVGYAVAEPSGVTGYLVGTGTSAASGAVEFQTSSYPPGYQFGPLSTVYGMSVDTMLDPQTTAFAGEGNLAPGGGIGTTASDTFLDSSSPTGLTLFQEFELFHYTWAADGSGTFGGNTFMVTNATKFFYIDTSPLNGHPAVIIGQQQQPQQ